MQYLIPWPLLLREKGEFPLVKERVRVRCKDL
jgi:hypothetical protein